jgi:hypothetical protein
MEPLAIHPRLLREAAGSGLTLTPGRGVMARVVAAAAGGRGVLNIAGVTIEAQLPPGVRVGESLRLIVRSLDEHRVVFGLPHDTRSEARPATAPTPSPLPEIPLPGGARLRLRGEGDDGSAAPRSASAPGTATLSLSYDAPSLGALDLSFSLDAGSVRLQIAAGAGAGYSLTRENAEGLQHALEQAVGRSASVTVVPRREPLDVYA